MEDMDSCITKRSLGVKSSRLVLDAAHDDRFQQHCAGEKVTP